MKWTKKMMKMT